MPQRATNRERIRELIQTRGQEPPRMPVPPAPLSQPAQPQPQKPSRQVPGGPPGKSQEELIQTERYFQRAPTSRFAMSRPAQPTAPDFDTSAGTSRGVIRYLLQQKEAGVITPPQTPAAPEYIQKPETIPQRPRQIVRQLPSPKPEQAGRLPLEKPEYVMGEPVGTPKQYGLWQGATASAQVIRERVAESIAGAGKKDWQPMFYTDQDAANKSFLEKTARGASALIHNIGQVPVLGNVLTTAVAGGLGVLQVIPEATEHVLGSSMAALPAIKKRADVFAPSDWQAGEDEYFGTTGLREELDVGEDPVKEQAFQAALQVTYSGRAAVRQAYREAYDLATQGQLSTENWGAVRERNQVWWKEAIGQLVFDPLNLVGGTPTKLLRARQATIARRLFYEPLRVGDEIMQSAEVGRQIFKAASTAGQAAREVTVTGKILSYTNPAVHQSVVHQLTQQSAQVIQAGFGSLEAKLAQQIVRDTPELAKLPIAELRQTEAFQHALGNQWTQWSRWMLDLANDNPAKVSQAAEKLSAFGFKDVGLSRAGRETAHIIRKLVGDAAEGDTVAAKLAKQMKISIEEARLTPEYANEVGGKFLQTITKGMEEGWTTERVVEQWLQDTSKAIGDLVEVPAWEQKFPATAVKATYRLLQPVKNVFSALFMGLSPGYATRNFADGFIKTITNGISPWQIMKRGALPGGVRAIRHAAGIGSVGEVSRKSVLGVPLVGLIGGEKGEKFFSEVITSVIERQEVTRNAVRAIDDVPVFVGVDSTLMRRVKSELRDIFGHGTLDDIEQLEARIYKQLDELSQVPAAPGLSAVQGAPPPGAAGSYDELTRLMEQRDGMFEQMSDLSQQGVKTSDEQMRTLQTASDALDDQIDNMVGSQMFQTATMQDSWKILPSTLHDNLYALGDDSTQQVAAVLRDAQNVDEAIEGVQNLIAARLQHVVSEIDDVADAGPMAGTLAEMAEEHAMRMGLDPKQTGKLIHDISQTEGQLMKVRNAALGLLPESPHASAWTRFADVISDAYEGTIVGVKSFSETQYARFVTGAITADEYVASVGKAHQQAARGLMGSYDRIIAESHFLGHPEHEMTLQRLLQNEVSRHALMAQMPGAIIKRGKKTLTEPATQYVEGRIVPRKQFGQFLEETIGRPVKEVTDLTEEEARKIITQFRQDLKLPPVTDEQLKRMYLAEQNRLSEYVLYVPKEREALMSRLTGGLEPTAYYVDDAGRKIPILEEVPWKGEIPKEKYLEWVTAQFENLSLTNEEGGLALDALRKIIQEGLDVDPTLARPDVLAMSNTDASKVYAAIIKELQISKEVPAPALRPVTALGDTGKQWQGYFSQMKNQFVTTHTLAAQVGNIVRDHALLDYGNRRIMDFAIGTIYPWGYWHSRSIPNFAMTLLSNPAYLHRYAVLKRRLREYTEQDPNIPAWAKEQIPLQVPGYPGMMSWNMDSWFNMYQGIADNFVDQDMLSTWMGRATTNLNMAGAGVNPLLMMAIAANRSLFLGEEDALRDYGYLSSGTRAFAAGFKKTLEPWLWDRDPETGRIVPLTGGSKWDVAKAQRLMGIDVKKGEVTLEAAYLANALRGGVVFENEMQKIMEYRRAPAIASFLFGISLGKRDNWEMEVSQLGQDYWNAKERGDEAGATTILENNPWLGPVWMSYDNEAERMGTLMWSVRDRMPPMSEEKQNQILSEAKIDPKMWDAFFSSYGKGEGNPLGDWDAKDLETFSDGIINLAELLKYPDKKELQLWREARSLRKEIGEALAQSYPEAQEQAKVYYGMLNAERKDEAVEYAKSSGFYDYQNALNKALVANPVLVQFYATPEKVDSLAKQLMHEEAERRWPGVHNEADTYYSITDPKEKQRYRIEHPNVSQYLNQKDGILEKTYTELSMAREWAGRDTHLPQTVDPIVIGTPTIAQRGVLSALEDWRTEISFGPPPRPEIEPSKYSATERRVWETEDQIYRTVQAAHPDVDVITLEQQYNQMSELYGKDSAKLFGQRTGLFNLWDEITLQKITHPEVLMQMEDKELERAAWALMNQEAERKWPNIYDTIAVGQQIPKTDRHARHEFYQVYHPEVGQFYDWREPAVEHYQNELTQRRGKLRVGFAVKQGETIPQIPLPKGPEENLQEVYQSINVTQ